MSREATFRGRLEFCSNFYWPCPVSLDGQMYDSVEHAHQASKFLDPAIRFLFRSGDGAGITPGTAKRLARRWTALIRKDWEQVSLGIMEDLVRQKFSLYTTLREMLLATGDEEKHNHLGRILMKIREEAKHGQGAQAAGVLP